MKKQDIMKNQLMKLHFQKLVNLKIGAYFIFKSRIKEIIEEDRMFSDEEIWILCENTKEEKTIDKLTPFNGYNFENDGNWEEDVLEITIDIIIQSIVMSPKNGNKSLIQLFKTMEIK